MTATSDYARVVEQLSQSRLTPYVAYVASDSVDGVGATNQVVVRVRDGKIVSGTSHFDVNVGSGVRVANPVTAPIFDAACYRATGESNATFEGAPAVKFDLEAICGAGDRDYAFTTLYAQPGTLRPIDANGVVPPDGDSKDVTVSMDQRFATFGGRVMPASMKIDVSGSGLMFWLQVHVRETFSAYRFLNSP